MLNKKILPDAHVTGVCLRRGVFVHVTKLVQQHRNIHKLAHIAPVSAFPLGYHALAAFVRC